MNWILIGVIVLLAQKENYTSIYGMANPLPNTGSTRNINPYIRHWEAANFDRTTLEEAHQQHIKQIYRRKKRELNSHEYENANIIKLNFFAHDKEFRLVLRQDPISVFAPDVEIENTEGPVDYDVSRIYTGTLEDDENSHIHAILTNDNLLDGTIATSTEQYYIEPSYRYSDQLPKSGIHTIVYKLSDVKMMKSVYPSTTTTTTTTEFVPIDSVEHCASEKLRRKLLKNNNLKNNIKQKSITSENEKTEEDNIQNIYKRHKHQQQQNILINVKNKDNRNLNNAMNDKKHNNRNIFNQILHELDISVPHDRHKRWLPDELSDNHQNPPLPLDLEVPYNDDMVTFDQTTITTTTTISKNNIKHNIAEGTSNLNQQNDPESDFISSIQNNSSLNTRNTNINNNNQKINNSNNNYENDSSFRRGINNNGNNVIYTKSNRNRNILLNEYNPNGNSDLNLNTRSHLINRYNNNILVNNFNSSLTTRFNNFLNSNNNYYFGNNNNNNNNNGNIFNSGSGSTSRPSHKTHVEIITKNGATKKPNIIVNNYNPDLILTSQNFNSHLNLNVRNDLTDMTNSARTQSYDKKSTCMLYLQADHTFYQKMGSDESSIEAITRHVQRANAIYRNTDFNGDGKPDNITFMIKRIKVHNANALKDPAYRFPGNYGVEKFLELFSEEDYDAFCLAYMFTYRDFEMGTLGLAWTGDLKNAGGVCEKNGHYRGSLKSLNTGIVTLLNYGKHVPPAVSHVTLAHEIGHNFGSPHDPEQCTPGGEDGNYIMFARATSGDKRNNNKFSPCSLKAIEPVLNAKARSAKGCFTEPQQSICGNGVVEPGEQCDCGWEEDCKDSCCFPMSRHPRLDEKPCTLTPHSMCSPSQGPCCKTDCSLKFGDKCRDDNGCRDPSFCDGRMPQCPQSVNKPNKTICNKEFVCYMGECTGSICLAYGLESCQCLPGPNDPKTKSCELCCKQPGEGNICKSSFQWNEPPYDVPDMYAKPGTPCNDYNGYCDVFQKCREVDPSGPLATLRKLLLSEESIASFKKWFHTNWYTVGLAAAGFVVLLVLSMKLLGKRSSKKLKSVTIIHSATTETVRLPEDNNGVIVHTAIRTKVPFKKKVRGERSNKIKTVNKKKAIKTQLLTNTATAAGSTGAAAAATTTTTTAVATTAALNSNGQVVTKTKGLTKIQKRLSTETPKKSIRNKKNRISVPMTADEQQQNKLNEIKKNNKKNKKHKEIIDYSNNSGNHTNTFGKVQKWLLESPIVSQPLSHIEHSSKVRKVMSKSQSTPERLVQKSPKKTKSVGNLSNEKVKLQVVYKPPFKFSLKLSKNATVKTHIIGGALGRSKRKTRSSGEKKGRIGAAPLTNTTAAAAAAAVATTNNGNNNKIIGEKGGRRAALLLRNIDEDCKNLTVNNYDNSEHNYETLNPKTNDNPYYENIKFNSNNDNNVNNDEQQQQKQQKLQQKDQDKNMPSSSKSATFRVNRSASNNNIDRQNIQINKNHLHQQPQQQQVNNNINYNRSNSMTNNNPFNIKSSNNNLRKISDNSMNLNRNFGSTQNLLPQQNSSSISSSSQSHTSNFFKTKKRNSLNLKSSNQNDNQNDLNRSNLLHSKKHSNSNLNLKRENSSSNIKINNELLQTKMNLIRTPTSLSSSSNNQQQQQTQRLSLSSSICSSSSSSNASSGGGERGTIGNFGNLGNRGSINNNIPRVSLNNITQQQQQQQQTGPAFARQTSLNLKLPPPPMPLPQANTTNNTNFYNYINNPNLNSIINPNINMINNTNNINCSNSLINNIRPHTASCLETRQFEWPNSTKSTVMAINNSNSDYQKQQQQHHQYQQQQQQSKHSNNSSNNKIVKDEQQTLPSDLEIMISDVENLVS